MAAINKLRRRSRVRTLALAAAALLLVIGGTVAAISSPLAKNGSVAAATAAPTNSRSRTTAAKAHDAASRKHPAQPAPTNQNPTAAVSLHAKKHTAQRSISPTRLAGQAIMTGFSGTSADAGLLARIRRGELGGVILFGENIANSDQLASLTSILQTAARQGHNPPLLIAVDQEGGLVRRIAAAPPYAAASAMARHSNAWIEQQGAASGRSLRALGVNVDLAPVADAEQSPTSFLGSRSFGADPTRVAGAVRAFVNGLQRSRVAATAKHFPGLGAARGNTDDGIVTVPSSRRELDQLLVPFKAAINSGVQLVMVSSAIYPALDPKDRPATFSPPIVTGLLRHHLQFHGVVITDSMDAPAARSINDASTQAISAGVDMLLYGDQANSEAAFAQLSQLGTSDRVFRSQLERAYKNTQRLKHWLQQRR